MSAQLIYPDGKALELTEEELHLLEDTLERIRRKHRLKEALDAIQSDPDKKPAAWWDEFEAELRSNKMTFPERNLELDDLPND